MGEVGTDGQGLVCRRLCFDVMHKKSRALLLLPYQRDRILVDSDAIVVAGIGPGGTSDES